MRRWFAAASVALALVVVLPAAAPAQRLPGETVEARRHFFGPQNVDAVGRVRSDRVIASWFSVASLAVAIDGHVVLLDSYIHKSEDRPGYVPTTTEELVALRPEAVFIGHGHFDHALTAGQIAARTGALLVGTPEHCDQARAEAAESVGREVPVRCLASAERGATPGQSRDLRPLGDGVGVTAVKHIHSDAEPPDGEGHETSVGSAPAPDPNLVLLHPPGPSLVEGLDPSGDEGGTVLYQLRVGSFSLLWNDSAGPLREQAPQLFDVLRRLPPTDVQFGAVLGFNDPTNGMRDPVDYLASIRPKVFYSVHHDFVAEYGASKNLEGVFRREMARRGDLGSEVRWLYDPFDYLRPHVATFEVDAPRFSDGGRCLARRSPIGPRNIGRVGLGRTASRLARLPGVRRRTRRSVRFCVEGGRGAVSAALSPRGRSRLVVTTAPSHGNRRVRPGSRTAMLARAYPRRRRVARALYRTGPRSTRLAGIRGGRVRFLAVADRALLRNRRSLLKHLRYSGVAR